MQSMWSAISDSRRRRIAVVWAERVVWLGISPAGHCGGYSAANGTSKGQSVADGVANVS